MDAMQNQFSFSRSARRLTRAGRAGLLGSVAAVAFLATGAKKKVDWAAGKQMLSNGILVADLGGRPASLGMK